jgi:hypothetical protein
MPVPVPASVRDAAATGMPGADARPAPPLAGGPGRTAGGPLTGGAAAGRRVGTPPVGDPMAGRRGVTPPVGDPAAGRVGRRIAGGGERTPGGTVHTAPPAAIAGTGGIAGAGRGVASPSLAEAGRGAAMGGGAAIGSPSREVRVVQFQEEVAGGQVDMRNLRRLAFIGLPDKAGVRSLAWKVTCLQSSPLSFSPPPLSMSAHVRVGWGRVRSCRHVCLCVRVGVVEGIAICLT